MMMLLLKKERESGRLYYLTVFVFQGCVIYIISVAFLIKLVDRAGVFTEQVFYDKKTELLKS